MKSIEFILSVILMLLCFMASPPVEAYNNPKAPAYIQVNITPMSYKIIITNQNGTWQRISELRCNHPIGNRVISLDILHSFDIIDKGYPNCRGSENAEICYTVSDGCKYIDILHKRSTQ